MQIHIPDEKLDNFLAYLALGVLHAIQRGVVPPTTGISTLGMPKLWMPMMDIAAVPREILDVFQIADELQLLQELAPALFDSKLTALIKRSEVELAKTVDPTWGQWEITPD